MHNEVISDPAAKPPNPIFVKRVISSLVTFKGKFSDNNFGIAGLDHAKLAAHVKMHNKPKTI